MDLILPPRTERCQVIPAPARPRADVDPTLEAALRALQLEKEAYERERARLDGETAALRAWAAALRRRARDLAARAAALGVETGNGHGGPA